MKGDRIAFVGSNENAKKLASDKTRIVDLRGRTVVPGMTDSHCHIFGIGEREMNLNLEGTNSREDFLAKVKARVDQTERGQWIIGRGWIETFWKPPQFPSHTDLDKIAPDNPVFLTRADGHAAITNTAALKIAKIDKNAANPFGGEILKDKTTGEPTGMLLDNAMDLAAKHIPKPTEAEREKAFLLGIDREIGLGWCEIQNAGSHAGDIKIIRKCFDEGKVKLRFINAVYGPGEDVQQFLREGSTINAYDYHFTQRTIKVIFDGALGSRGAALLKPYSDAPDTSGFLTEKESDLKRMFEEALRRGIQVETHAIGDRTNRTILDLYQNAFKAVPLDQRKIRDPRWRVEHALFRAGSTRNGASRWRLLLAKSHQIRLHHRGWFRCTGRARRTNDRILRRGRAQERERIFRRRLASGASRHARASAEDVHALAGLRHLRRKR